MNEIIVPVDGSQMSEQAVALAMAFRDAPPRETSTVAYRDCPNCQRSMKREAGVCPHCRVESAPWTHHAGFWWIAGKSGRWQWLDEKANLWRWYPEGTPSSPSVTDQTPSHELDPAVISPPGTDAPIAIERQGASVPPSAELERLADLHARGVLTDEEFQQAKQQVLRN